MAETAITLDFLTAQQRASLDEIALSRTEMAAIRSDVALIKDDIAVLTAMAERQDRATKTVLNLVQALAEQQTRCNDRLRRLEERQGAT